MGSRQQAVGSSVFLTRQLVTHFCFFGELIPVGQVMFMPASQNEDIELLALAESEEGEANTPTMVTQKFLQRRMIFRTLVALTLVAAAIFACASPAMRATVPVSQK